jgi:hypothetical protein
MDRPLEKEETSYCDRQGRPEETEGFPVDPMLVLSEIEGEIDLLNRRRHRCCEEKWGCFVGR